MMIIEMRDAAYEKAFELVDKAKHYSKKQKMILCALEDALYECYESSQENDENEYEGDGEYEMPEGSEYEENESDISFRGSRSGMRGGMRWHHDGIDSMQMRRGRMRKGMRRDRYGRYSY